MRERLTRHFVRRFVDNDLLSPDTDRHEVLAVLAAALVSSSLFLTVALCFKYSFGVELPGPAALWALNDRFLYIAGSMIVTGLATLAVWDALGLDARDAAILGPLPIPRGVIIRAKLAALTIFGLGFAVAINLVPTLLHPVLVVAKLDVTAEGLLRLIAVHGLVTMGAGVFGFMVVVTLRAVSQVALGDALFARLSAVIQAMLVLVLVSTLFLLPGIASNVSASWLERDTPSRAFVPPLWFLGLYETAAGDVVVNGLHVTLDPDAPRLAQLMAVNQRATDAYRGYRDTFRELASVAGIAIALVALVGAPACAWSLRRPHLRAPAHRRRRRISAAILGSAARAFIRRPVAHAGFFFTLQTLARNPAHRIVIAATAGAGLAGAIVTLGGSEIRETIAAEMPLTVILAAQFVLVSALVIGFRHAVRIPAEPGANWIFQLAWSGDERAYLSGVKQAAVLALIVPALLTLLPLNVMAMGWRTALAHSAAGLMAGLILEEILLMNFRRPAFACSYLPGGTVNPLAPVALVGFAGVTYAFASLERLALSNAGGTMRLLIGLVACMAIARAWDLWKRRRPIEVVFNELPAPATQRFELNE